MQILEAGSAKVDITPKKPVPLAGFAVRENKNFEGVRSPIYLRALFLRQRGKDGSVRNALIVSADLIWWGSDLMPDILRTLKERWGLEPGSVILNSTHSHCGPQTSFQFHRLLGKADREYVNELIQKLYEAVAMAESNAEPVTVERGRGESRIGVQRRRYADGRVYGGSFPDGLMDPEVIVVRFRTANGSPKAVIVHYACHPVTTTDNYVSSEFTGAAMEMLEQELGDGAVCLFMQGCCGDINIYKESAPPELAGNDEAIIRYFGEKLSQCASAVLSGAMQTLAPTELKGRADTLSLELKPLETKEELERIAAEGKSPYDEWAAEMLGKIGERPETLTLTLCRLDVAEGFSLLAMSAEVVVEYGLYLKELSRGKIVPVPYSNGMLGYIPTRKQVGYGGYESETSSYYFHMPGRFAESVEEAMHRKLAELSAD
jgi:hypothetical protein